MTQKSNKDESVRRQLLELASLDRPALLEKWRDFYGTEPPNSSREFLRRRLAYRIQEIFYGGLDSAIQMELTPEIVPNRKLKGILRDGSRISREWHGKKYEVIVRGEKYEFEGRLYRSLSGIARAITGTNWNGNEFFGMRKK